MDTLSDHPDMSVLVTAPLTRTVATTDAAGASVTACAPVDRGPDADVLVRAEDLAARR